MRKESGIRIMIAVIFPLLLCIAAVFWYQQQLAYEHKRNDYLKKSLAEVEEQLGDIDQINSLKYELLSRMKIISEIGSAVHYGPVHILGDLSRNLPEGISLEAIHLLGDELTVFGEAIDKNTVAAFRDRLISTGYLSMQSEDNLTLVPVGALLGFKLIMHASKSKVNQEQVL